jgi:bifunctional DNA-binding transcriptional regulator/antitoxin component of YhaV-PrlF toxin-antitoxin module
MAVTQKEIEDLVSLKVDIEKISKISSDGKNFLSRIPKEIAEFLELKKSDKIKWYVNLDKKIKIEVIR